MTDREFAMIIENTKKIVLSAIGKHLFEKFHHAIDDVAQETYIRAYSSLLKEKFRGDSAVGTWLYSIARNESIRMNQKLSREEEKAVRSAKIKYDELKNGSADSAEEISSLKELICKLPENYQKIMELVYEGKSEKEIALNLGIKQGTVKSRTSRGREILKKMISGAKI